MDWKNFLLMVVFAVALLGSPGPATISLAASGIAYGYKRSMPFLMGIIIGFFFNMLAVALGLGYIFTHYSEVYDAFKYISFVCILYISYRVATSGPIQLQGAKPFSYMQGILLDVTNPKAYVASIAVLTQFAKSDVHYYRSVAIIIATNMVLASVLQFGWCYAGDRLSKLVSSPKASSRINVVLAIVMVASVAITMFAY